MPLYSSYHPDAERFVTEYIGTGHVMELLGWGIDGVVFAHPLVSNAIKVHKNQESFEKELAAYKRLSDRRVEKFMGFSVPQLMGHDRQLRVVELSIVKPPFLLDFAAATVDKKNDFSPEDMELWWQDVEHNFGDDYAIARDVFWGLKTDFGIYYWDLKPRNLCFR